jgi:hypothetical protein
MGVGGLTMFDDLHDPDPPKAGLDTLARVSSRAKSIRRRRSLTAAASSLAVVALAVAAVVVPNLGDDRDRITTVDSVAPTPSSVVDTTVDSTIDPAPSTTEPEAVTPTAPPTTECTTVPQPPAYLVDGSVPGDPVTSNHDDGTSSVQWGSDETTRVIQGVGADAPFVAGPESVARGDFRATITPIGDSSVGQIGITITDDSNGCIRHYWIGPGVALEQAIAYTTQWLAYLDIDRSITVQEAPDDQACTYSAGVLVACVTDSVGDNGEPRRPLADGRSDEADPAVRVLQLLVEAGSEAAPLSGLARRVPVLGTELELIVDLIPQGQSCGRVTAPNGASTGWSIGGQGEGTCSPPPSSPQTEMPIVAIDGNGDAVLIEAIDGTSTVLADGTDPDDPLPSEGEVTHIDGVSLSPDGTALIVGDCCEPIPGSLSRVDPSTGERTFFGYGHFPSFTTFGQVVSEALGTIGLTDVDGSQVTTLLEIDPGEGTIVDLAVVSVDGVDLVLAIVKGPEGTSLIRAFAAGGDMQLTIPISSATWTDDAEFSLGGWAGGQVFVLDEANDAWMAFDTETLSAIPTESSVDWISAWSENGAMRYIDSRRRLFVDGAQVPGEYLWVR